MEIYIVMGSQGEYSDRTEWVECAYSDMQRAMNRVVALEHKQLCSEERRRYAASYWVTATALDEAL